jgi:peptidoglycan/xylan/chitin deacetylase (PgdA/CDA1 family)
VRSFPELVRRIVAEGHELGNHSDTHPDLTTLPDRQVVAELARAEAAVMAVTGQTTRPWFRPPLGARDERIRNLAAAMGYRTVYWTLDSTDWREETTAAMVRQRVLQYAGDGAIIVCHVGSQATGEALPSLLDDLIAAGYRPVTLSELLAAE